MSHCVAVVFKIGGAYINFAFAYPYHNSYSLITGPEPLENASQRLTEIKQYFTLLTPYNILDIFTMPMRRPLPIADVQSCYLKRQRVKKIKEHLKTY